MTDNPLPPHSVEAERAVLGSILIDPSALHRITPIIGSPLDFHDQQHQ